MRTPLLVLVLSCSGCATLAQFGVSIPGVKRQEAAAPAPAAPAEPPEVLVDPAPVVVPAGGVVLRLERPKATECHPLWLSTPGFVVFDLPQPVSNWVIEAVDAPSARVWVEPVSAPLAHQGCRQPLKSTVDLPAGKVRVGLMMEVGEAGPKRLTLVLRPATNVDPTLHAEVPASVDPRERALTTWFPFAPGVPGLTSRTLSDEEVLRLAPRALFVYATKTGAQRTQRTGNSDWSTGAPPPGTVLLPNEPLLRVNAGHNRFLASDLSTVSELGDEPLAAPTGPLAFPAPRTVWEPLPRLVEVAPEPLRPAAQKFLSQWQAATTCVTNASTAMRVRMEGVILTPASRREIERQHDVELARCKFDDALRAQRKVMEQKLSVAWNEVLQRTVTDLQAHLGQTLK
ncbi:MAG: hypothetical protein U0228_17400 [Myxococcaceae bacterium]